jgi:dihydroxyacid dehydratase/phosphogluconate dehydratase
MGYSRARWRARHRHRQLGRAASTTATATSPSCSTRVERGVHAAGGLPVDFPTISLGEVFLEPTSMLYRNLMSMDVEEMIRAQPMDAVVLVGGCDKTCRRS